jgi:phosphodiesterase/alkaline phosphatase D-like protein
MNKYIFFLLFLSLCISEIGAQDIEITNSIAVGGVTSNSARFWVRTSVPSFINIEVSEDQNFTSSILGSEKETTSERGNSNIIDVSGLNSSTRYFYRVISGDEIIDDSDRSFWTFPAEGSRSDFSFAFGSCQQSGRKDSSDSKSVFDEIVKHDLKFFLQLGDWGYPDTTDDFPENNNFFTTDYSLIQESYRTKYDKDYPMDQLLRKMAVDYVYDDHDYMNNNSSALTSSFYVPFRPNDYSDDFYKLEIGNPPGARENSIRGYKENLPGYELENESRGIYHSFKYGNAEFFMLDLRSQKSSALNPFIKNVITDNWEFIPPEGHSILGREETVGEGESQLSWLLNGLKNSTAEWKFIISSVAFNIGQRAALTSALLLQDVVINIEGAPPGATAIAAAFELADGWTGFQEDADNLLNFIAENDIKNVIMLSGDTHNAALDDGENAGLPEMMAGNLDITNSRTVELFESFGIQIWNKGGHGISTDEYNDAFGKVTLYGSDSVKLSLIDEFGTIFAEHTVLSELPTSIERNNIVAEYSLKQNYPNPFNPSTVIEYSVPALNMLNPSGAGNATTSQQIFNVELKVYDILGREAAILVNKRQKPGNYKVEFNTVSSRQQLASGVYVYRLSIYGNKNGTNLLFNDTKKMILLR